MELPVWWSRFWSKVAVRPWDCWEWTAILRKDGYGRFGLDGAPRLAHRLSYMALIGSLLEEEKIDHLCRNRRCVNPDHMESVTNRTNILRGINPAAINARKTHCNNGHPLAGDNLYVETTGKRKCKTCMRAVASAYYYRRKEREVSH